MSFHNRINLTPATNPFTGDSFSRIGISKYGNRNYLFEYDLKNGDTRIRRIDPLRPDVFFENDVFENGGFTENGANDENLYTNGVTFQQVQDDFVKKIKEAYEQSGKVSNNSVLPEWVINKYTENLEGIIPEGEKEKAKAFDPELYKGIQKSDRVLQRLSLRNLKYPIDADYGNTQDYVQINQFTYKAVNPEVLFPPSPVDGGTDFSDALGGLDFDDPNSFGQGALPGRGGSATTGLNPLQVAGQNAKSTLLTGLSMQSPKEEHIGLVKLPMPNQLSDSNNVAWGEDQLNAITAAAATLATGGLQTGIDFLEDIAKGDKGFREAFSSILTGTGDSFNGIVGFLKDAQRSPNANLLARSTVGSSLLNLVGFGVSPEAILARGAGVVPNSNLQLLFNAPTLRAFRFDWKMSPRSREEAIRINNIIRFFKQGMAAKKMQPNSGGGAYFLGTPNVFDITFRTSKLDKEITNENNAVLRIKTCACVGAAVNYTPEGMWNAYEKGQPTSCILSLQFKELEPLFNTDYDEDPFSYGDLTGFIPSDAVGY